MSSSMPRSGLMMQIVGALMLLGSVLYLFLVEDPFPMWLLIGGAGLMFIGVGSAIQRQRSGGTRGAR